MIIRYFFNVENQPIDDREQVEEEWIESSSLIIIMNDFFFGDYFAISIKILLFFFKCTFWDNIHKLILN